MKFGDKKVPAALGLIPMVLRTSGVPTVSLLHIFRTGRSRKCRFAKNKVAQKIYNFIGTTLTSFKIRWWQ
jgi:hypothetical protein